MTTPMLRRRPSLLSRLGDSVLAVVGPQSGVIPQTFTNPCLHTQRYEDLIDEIQRFRGSIYVEDGTIPASALDAQGRHRTPFDYSSWHFLLLKETTRIIGCMCATPHPSSGSVCQLRLYEMIARMHENLKYGYHAAIQSYLGQAHRSGRDILEVGGWAVSKEYRNSSSAAVVALACYSLSRLLGNPLVLASAGRCNHSAQILHRLGGFPLSDNGVELAAFFDEHHQCEIELLGFDCWQVPEVYEQSVEDITNYLRTAVVTAPSEAAAGNTGHDLTTELPR